MYIFYRKKRGYSIRSRDEVGTVIGDNIRIGIIIYTKGSVIKGLN